MPASGPPLPPSGGLKRMSELSQSFRDLCAVAPVPVQPTSKLSQALHSSSPNSFRRSTAADLLNEKTKFVPVVRCGAMP